VQIIITYLILIYTPSSLKTPLLLLVTVSIPLLTTLLLSPLISSSTLSLLAASCVPLSLSSKLPQIVTNFSRKSTGQLSAFVVINSFVGCLARVYTTVMETKDGVLFWGFVGAAVLNGVLVLQLMWYWNDDRTVKGGRVGQEEKGMMPKEEFERVKEKEEKKVQEIVGGVEHGRTEQDLKEKMGRNSPTTQGRKYVRKLD
jgi:mannose-P-dolichol utilization defect protein 1